VQGKKKKERKKTSNKKVGKEDDRWAMILNCQRLIR
jgi:hypothetical protein